jgi:hypothetical protein
MRKISQDAADSFHADKNFKNGNTQVISEDCGNVVRLYLFGNCIAQRTPLATTITTDGWMTNTTKERLNALNGVHINQEKGKWYLNGEPWNGDNVIIGAFGIWREQ